MAEFCKSHKYVYIYRTKPVQKLISKYMFMSEFKLEGFIKPEVYEEDRECEPFPIYNLAEMKKKVDNIENAKDIGVIISTDDSVYNQIMYTFKVIGIEEFFLVSGWNKRAIPKKMEPRKIENFCLEVNLADHCNLNCQCCDHFSPIASKTFLDYDQYVKDIKRLAKLTNGQLGFMKLQGGEPLLNENLIDFMQITREVFQNTVICLMTDGLLLDKWNKKEGYENIWEAVQKYETEVRLTQYPIPMDMDKIIKAAEFHDISITFDPPEFKKETRLWIFSEIGDLKYRGVKHSVKHPFDLFGKQEKYRWISCYQFNECIVLRKTK